MAANYIKVPRTLSATLLTRIVEHLTDLGVETGEDDAVKERVEASEDDRTDYDSDDDLNPGVNVAFCLDVLDGGLCTDCQIVHLVLNLIEKLLQSVSPPFDYAV